MSFLPLKDAGGENTMFYDFGDICLPLNKKTREQKKAHLDSIKTMQFRSDDVFLCTYPKSVTHILPDKLPDDLLTSGRKIILVLRNPKDVAVSMYYHLTSDTSFKYKGKWKNFLPVFLSDKCVYYPWFTVVDTWQRLKAAHPSAPILTVMFEDLIKNPLIEVNRMVDFLDVAVDGERATFIQKVVDKTIFSNMKKNEINKSPEGTQFIFRKGMIGDWKNHFTVAENEKFDAWYQQRMTHNDLKFTFTQDDSS